MTYQDFIASLRQRGHQISDPQYVHHNGNGVTWHVTHVMCVLNGDAEVRDAVAEVAVEAGIEVHFEVIAGSDYELHIWTSKGL